MVYITCTLAASAEPNPILPPERTEELDRNFLTRNYEHQFCWRNSRL